MRLDRKELELRLAAWADEYGGGKYEHIGFPSRTVIGKLVEMQGHVPSGVPAKACASQTPADEVDAAVRRMESEGYDRPARVLRCEYFMGRLSIEGKLRALERSPDGFKVGRATYYDYLSIAKAYVHGQLSKDRAA